MIFKSGGCWSLTGYRRTLIGNDAIEMIFDGGTVDENDLIGRCSRRRSRRSPWSTWLRQVSLTPLAFRRLSLAVALGPDEMAYTEEGRIP